MNEIKTGKLAEALAKAQGEISSAKKDSLNPHFKSKYADIASVIEAIQVPLSKYGISYMQYAEFHEGSWRWVTKVMHGPEEMIGYIPLLISKLDMQGLGSAITYARRYALSAMFGVAQDDDDDDGNLATSKGDKATSTVIKPKDEAPVTIIKPMTIIKPKEEMPPLPPTPPPPPSHGEVDPMELQKRKVGRQIKALMAELDVKENEIKKICHDMFKNENFKSLSLKDLSGLLTALENEKDLRNTPPKVSQEFEDAYSQIDMPGTK